jgi:hypothetical protein
MHGKNYIFSGRANIAIFLLLVIILIILRIEQLLKPENIHVCMWFLNNKYLWFTFVFHVCKIVKVNGVKERCKVRN